MLKEALIVAVAAGGGTYISQRWGQKIEAQAVAMHVPPVAAHMAVVGGFAAGVYFVVRRFV
jgi:hypothetical protein